MQNNKADHINLNYCCFLVIVALLLNIFFFSFNRRTLFFTYPENAEIGYNVYAFNSLKVNQDRIDYVKGLQTANNYYYDYADIAPEKFAPAASYRSINDTIGYGVLLGLVWKITHSLRYRDIQIIQVIIFSLLIILYYYINCWLFLSRKQAFISSCIFLSFFPLVILNVQAIRDSWGYYGLIILFFTLLYFFEKKESWFLYTLGITAFSLCQHIRPTIFFCLPFLLIITWLQYRNRYQHLTLLVGWTLLLNGLIFWVPFALYNKLAYNHYFVAPVGQDLLEGMGEFPNKWGYQCNDTWFEQFMLTHYNLKPGTLACDQKAKELFWQTVQANPWHHCKILIKRLPQLFFTNPLWTNGVDNFLHPRPPLHQALKTIARHPFQGIAKLIDFTTTRLWYIELFLLLGWLGVLVMLYEKKYFETFFLLSVFLQALSKYPSHLEPRYMIISYWALAPFITNLFYRLRSMIRTSSSWNLLAIKRNP